jgi:hypothetical protein
LSTSLARRIRLRLAITLIVVVEEVKDPIYVAGDIGAGGLPKNIVDVSVKFVPCRRMSASHF